MWAMWCYHISFGRTSRSMLTPCIKVLDAVQWSSSGSKYGVGRIHLQARLLPPRWSRSDREFSSSSHPATTIMWRPSTSDLHLPGLLIGRQIERRTKQQPYNIMDMMANMSKNHLICACIHFQEYQAVFFFFTYFFFYIYTDFFEVVYIFSL